jgi:hypothetical protein
MPNASNSLQKRKRGGQPGNSNRKIHGRYTKKEAARREELREYRRKGRALVILVDNILKARKALKRRLAARALAATLATPPSSPRAETQRALPRRRNTARRDTRTQSSRAPPRALGPPNPVPAPSYRPSHAIRR